MIVWMKSLLNFRQARKSFLRILLLVKNHWQTKHVVLQTTGTATSYINAIVVLPFNWSYFVFAMNEIAMRITNVEEQKRDKRRYRC